LEAKERLLPTVCEEDAIAIHITGTGIQDLYYYSLTAFMIRADDENAMSYLESRLARLEGMTAQ